MLLLGGWHGLNPAMGWLFAVALGLQANRRSDLWRALPPLAVGHAAAVVAAIALAGAAGSLLSARALGWFVGAALVAFGIYRLVRPRHPRFGGMRLGPAGLAAWSALVSSTHGAGLMVVPFLLPGLPNAVHGDAAHTLHVAATIPPPEPFVLAATAAHTLGYLLVTTASAVLVYEKLGLRLLGRAWFNLDLLWGAALVLTGVGTALF
ncbi:MAG TPA: hypothetical protein VFM14_17605 [Gemmatimonadales bacterium]|nr:hypothetical protein [Gemmatimonadales bacterium]